MTMSRFVSDTMILRDRMISIETPEGRFIHRGIVIDRLVRFEQFRTSIARDYDLKWEEVDLPFSNALLICIWHDKIVSFAAAPLNPKKEMQQSTS